MIILIPHIKRLQEAQTLASLLVWNSHITLCMWVPSWVLPVPLPVWPTDTMIQDPDGSPGRPVLSCWDTLSPHRDYSSGSLLCHVLSHTTMNIMKVFLRLFIRGSTRNWINRYCLCFALTYYAVLLCTLMNQSGERIKLKAKRYARKKQQYFDYFDRYCDCFESTYNFSHFCFSFSMF